MNQSKIIEFSKSTLISLKAELLRKQDEVNKAKLEPKNQINNFTPTSKFDKDEGEKEVTERKEKKPLVDAEEAEMLRKSKESLERKTRLYDHLSEGTISSEKDENYLVNFKKKASEGNTSQNDNVTNSSDIKSDDDDDDQNDDVLSDDEWIDYEDCLGRVRRCHKSDLEHIKKQDEDLKESLYPTSKKSEVIDKQWVKEGTSVEQEPPDAYKEMLRSQWEKKEQELLNKDTVHYQDVLFNEARTHGVGYYALSGDEAIRAKQQAELKRLHEETERERVAASEARAKREHALQLRVRAARARQRARAGLPPEEEEPESAPSVTSMLLDFVEEQKKASSENSRKEREAREIEAQKEREKFVREWDLGKEDSEKQRHKVMTQEEWVDKKRKERPKEFAPQSESRYSNKKSTSFDDRGFYFDTQGDSSLRAPTWEDVRPTNSMDNPGTSLAAASNQSLYFTTKKRKDDIKNKYFDPSVNTGVTFDPVPIRNEAAEDDGVKIDTKCPSERKGAEVAPPPTYEYYGPADRKRKKEEKKIDVEESFEVGLHLLEEKALKKGQRKGRDFADDF
ncbi:uncharacterized protein LOC143911074 [Arctopsyche grandis]|uniref:uncharacterized protein LOC143911074 n=1 Tax=Arctopsyche grandis TaxID=121162 RepID=UPI00406D87DA